MNIGVYNPQVYNPKAFNGKKNPAKTLSSIDIAYEKELKEIQRRKQDREVIYLLNPETPFEKAKNKIQNVLMGIKENH